VTPDADLSDEAFAKAMLRHHCLALQEITDIALERARQIAADPQPNAGMALARIDRAIRQNGLVQAKLLREIDDVTARAQRLAEGEPIDVRPDHLTKVRVGRIIDRIATDNHPDDEDEQYRLVVEADERLDDEDRFDFLNTPIAEIVRALCQDLDLDYSAFKHERWASENPTRPPPLAGEGDHEVVERACRATDVSRKPVPYYLRSG
jgi:hypothetical protein